MPRLPFERVDLLLIDEIGKNISGTGMDTNVVGRKFNDHIAAAEDEFPKVKRIIDSRPDRSDARQRHRASAWPSSARARRGADGHREDAHQLPDGRPHRRPR